MMEWCQSSSVVVDVVLHVVSIVLEVDAQAQRWVCPHSCGR